MMKRLKDLKVGDRVKFENVYEHDDIYISGKGIITGFGVFGSTEYVWIETEEYGKKGIVYEEVVKIEGTSKEG